ncbi:hypothetical protein, partial [Collinsella aerofaciens]|uniref:hypothetical protein n=1 Tax=Collinsella aerofaciens TaxID=74426 RepID=UPI00195D3A6B
GFAPQDSAQRVALSPEAVAMKMRIKDFQKTLQILLLSPPHAIGVYIIESLFLAQQSGVKWKKAFWI